MKNAATMLSYPSDLGPLRHNDDHGEKYFGVPSSPSLGLSTFACPWLPSFAVGGFAFALFAFNLVLPTAARAQFEIEESHTTASLRGIANAGGGIAWASGTGGTVLRTRDDGKTWQTCPVPLAGTKDTAEKLDFRGIQAFDENTAIVMSSGPGDQSRLYKTTDGCQTWKLLFTNPDKDGFWDAIVAHAQPVYKGKPLQVDGRILGDPVDGHFCIYDFFDGYSWARKLKYRPTINRNIDPSLKADSVSAGAFAASNSAYVHIPWRTADRGDIDKGAGWKTSNLFVTGGTGGAQIYESLPTYGDVWEPTQWKVSALPLGAHTESSGAFSIAVASDRRAGAVVGGEYMKPDIASDSAAYYSAADDSWLPAQTTPHGYRSSVAYESKTKTWITVGPNGTDISTDDGRNWRPLTPTPQDAPDADKNWNALSLPFIVGPHGRIGKLRPTALAIPLAKAKP